MVSIRAHCLYSVLYLAEKNFIRKVEITVTSNGSLSSTVANLLKGADDGPRTPARLAIDRAAEKLYWFNVKNNNNVKQNKKSIKFLNLADPNPSAVSHFFFSTIINQATLTCFGSY